MRWLAAALALVSLVPLTAADMGPAGPRVSFDENEDAPCQGTVGSGLPPGVARCRIRIWGNLSVVGCDLTGCTLDLDGKAQMSTPPGVPGTVRLYLQAGPDGGLREVCGAHTYNGTILTNTARCAAVLQVKVPQYKTSWIRGKTDWVMPHRFVGGQPPGPMLGAFTLEAEDAFYVQDDPTFRTNWIYPHPG